MKSILLALFIPAAASADAAWTWIKDGNRAVELRGTDGPVVRFVLDAAPRDPHFEILATSDGRNTVWVRPADHVWHYGLWFSWKHINGVNFWETNPATGLQQGLNRIADPMIECEPDGETATIRYRELAHPDPDGPAVLEDSVVIRITRPGKDRGPQVEWRVETKALADVTLDRTPIPGEPGGRDFGGYAGFSWRGAKEFKDVRFTDSEGREDSATHREHSRWIHVTGSLHDKPAGLVIIDHPGNPGHPASWYVSSNAKLPFWYASPALLQPKAVTLKQGGSFRHAYQVIVHDGGWEAGECEKAARIFGKESSWKGN